MREMRSRLENLGEDVSELQLADIATVRQLPWTSIRLAIELSILAVAAGLFYFSLR